MKADWSTATLGELTARTRPIQYGVLKPGPFDPEGVPLLRIQDLAGNRVASSGLHFISHELDSEFSRSRLAGDEILLSIQGTIGRVALVPRSFAGANVSRTLAVIAPDSRIDRGFLRHHLMWIAARRGFHSTGTTRASLNIGEIRQISVPIPPVDEQRRIAAVLDHVDAIRAKRRASLRMWDSVVDVLFAKVPGGQRVSIGDVVELQGGLTLGPKRAEYPRELAYLRVANVMRGCLELADVKTTRVTDKEVARTRLKQGDVLVVEGHGNVNEIGRAAMWSGEFAGDVSHQNHLFRLRPDVSQVLPQYLVNFLNSPDGRRQMRTITTTTSGLNTINSSKLKTIHMRVPPLSAQRHFAAQVGQIDMVRATAVRHLAELDALFASLQSSALAGELDVSKVVLPS